MGAAMGRATWVVVWAIILIPIGKGKGPDVCVWPVRSASIPVCLDPTGRSHQKGLQASGIKAELKTASFALIVQYIARQKYAYSCCTDLYCDVITKSLMSGMRM